MAQLKEDEWPGEGQPTTHETQMKDGRKLPVDRDRGKADEDPVDADDELRKVTPDEAGD